ncbi:MAG TPA: hypothetical protein VGM39_14310 [Kofleriaceae bacterium]
MPKKPTSSVPRAVKAQVKKLLLAEDEERALALLQPYLGTDPSVWVDVGFLLYSAGGSEAALEHFARAIAIDPDCRNAFVGRAVVLGQDGSLTEALDAIEHALALEPYADGYKIKELILDGLGRKKDADAARAEAMRRGATY